MDDEQILKELKQAIQEYNADLSDDYRRMAEDLEFESGEQWEDKERSARESDGLPCLVANYTKSYVDRIVNPYILSPIGGEVEGSPADDVVNQMLDSIRSKTQADEAIQTAFRHAVTCGRGFVHVGSYYADDTSMDQEVSIDSIIDPTLCALGPHDNIDGSDADCGFWVRYLPESSAKSKYGDDVEDVNYQVYEDFQQPDHTIPSIVFYKKKYKEIKRKFTEDGRYYDGKEDENGSKEYVTSRKIKQPYVECSHIVGEIVVSKATMDLPYIPIIPIYGNRKYCSDGITYSGIVDLIRDTQRRINNATSIEDLMIANAPKSPWVATAGQIKGFEDIWKTANRKSYDVLTYNEGAPNQPPKPPPMRVDNEARTQAVSNSKAIATEDLGRETSIYDQMFGIAQTGGVESAQSIIARSNNGEIATAHYTDNLNKSIKQIYRVCVWMMNTVYDTPRQIIIDDKPVQVEFQQLMVDPRKLSFNVSTGPALESRKKESNVVLSEMAKADPERAPLYNFSILSNLSFADKGKVLKAFERTMPPEMVPGDDKQVEQPDPQAMQALQQAQQTITALEDQVEYLMSVVQQFQTAMIDDEKDRQADILKERIKTEASMAEEELKARVDLAKAGIKADVDLEKIQADFVAKTQKMIDDAFGKLDKATLEVETNEADEVSDLDIAPMAEGPVSVDDVGQDQAELEINQYLSDDEENS